MQRPRSRSCGAENPCRHSGKGSLFNGGSSVPPARTSQHRIVPTHTQSYEMPRAWVFGATIRTYSDPAYTTFALAVLTLFGMWLMRESRKYVVIE